MSDLEPTEYETVLYDVADHVPTVTLNRPEVHNVVNFELRRDIVTAVRRAETDAEATVVLLKGAGRSFCAGYDLKIPDFMEARKGHTGWVGDPNLEEWTDQFSRG